MDIKPLVIEILDKASLMSLGTQDTRVWVSDVIFVYDDSFCLYWLSEVKVRHSHAILQNPQVAATITLEKERKGLQIEGTAEKIKGDIFEMAKKHRLKRGKPEPTKEGEILGSTESWYKLTPSKIELIYEPLFGFEKKQLILQ